MRRAKKIVALDMKTVKLIRAAKGAGMKSHDVAKEFGVTLKVVREIADGTKWGWVK